MFIEDLKRQRKINEMLKIVMASTLAMVAGISLGFLFAPKSGKETREDIANKLDKTANTLKSTAAEVIESITSIEEHMEKNIKDAAEKIKDNLDETADDVATYAEDAKHKLTSKIVTAGEVLEEKWDK